MPLEIHEAISPTGLHYLVLDAAGRVEGADAEKFADWVAPGQPHNLGYVLSRVAKGTDYSPEARRSFSSMGVTSSAIALVVTSPIVRASVNLMLRYAGQKGDRLRMFTTEDEALAWLESQRRLQGLHPDPRLQGLHPHPR